MVAGTPPSSTGKSAIVNIVLSASFERSINAPCVFAIASSSILNGPINALNSFFRSFTFPVVSNNAGLKYVFRAFAVSSIASFSSSISSVRFLAVAAKAS